MTTANDKLHIDLMTRLNGSYLSDRWGNICDSNYDQSSIVSLLQQSGLTRQCIEHRMQELSHCFGDEVCFLVLCRPSPSADKPELCLLVEFEFAEEWLPEVARSDPETPDGREEWKRALLFHAPAMAHAARSIRDLPDDGGRGMQCMFDFSAFYGGSLCVLMPVAQAAHYDAVRNILFENGLTFPPSAHAQIEAISRIAFTLCNDDISPCIVP